MADPIGCAIPYLIHVEFGNGILCTVLRIPVVDEENILLHTLHSGIVFDGCVILQFRVKDAADGGKVSLRVKQKRREKQTE